MPDTGASSNPHQIPTNLRLLHLIEVVARAGGPVTPAAVKDLLGLPKPTLHRLFNTAEAEGFLQRDLNGRAYGPGPRLRRLAIDTLSSEQVRQGRLAVLSALATDIGETCNIAIPGSDGMTYLDRAETEWPLRIQLPVGTKVPLHCTAAGKMYLASLGGIGLTRFLESVPLSANTAATITDPELLRRELERTQRRGYSTDNEEFMAGMVAIAVPVLDGQDRLLATLSVHAPIQRHDIAGLTRFLDRLNAAARKLTRMLIP